MRGHNPERREEHSLLAWDIPGEIRSMRQMSKILHVEMMVLGRGCSVPLKQNTV